MASVLFVWGAIKVAGWKIIVAGLTLLPALISYFVYTAILEQQPLSTEPGTWPVRARLIKHIAFGLFAALIIAYGLGQSCPTDDGGFCLDDDWKAPTAGQSLAHFIRLFALILIGMAAAYRGTSGLRWAEEIVRKSK